MKRIALNHMVAQMSRAEQGRHSTEEPRRLLYGGMIGLIGGSAAPVFGSLLTALSWLLERRNFGELLHRAGDILLISTIPLLVLSAFCLDAYERSSGRESPEDDGRP